MGDTDTLKVGAAIGLIMMFMKLVSLIQSRHLAFKLSLCVKETLGW
jgi:hypothetical protein